MFCDAMLRLITPSFASSVDVNLDWIDEFESDLIEYLPYIMTILGAGAVLYSIYLGVNMARADSSEKAQEAKKRIVNFFIGIAIMIGLILLMLYLIHNIRGWFNS